MISNLLKSRRSRKLRRRKVFRPLVEQLEDRRLLATLVFDTELVSLNLSGGPYPMPLASDPANLLGDSIDGYGFVDAEVSITLASQRLPDATPPGPGPPSVGQACATNEQSPAGDRGCLFGQIPPSQDPINPAELDGQPFFVDSFFDVFFDITVTDVDSRPGRDFAGQADGASFLLPNNGPANMISIYTRIFDKDAPNYGLIPPPEVAPYIGHFQIEIPLGGDINGNGENDKIKFTIASHAAGDGNRTFTQLPDGTVLDEFDSAAFLEGAIVDESTDPPFTLGAGSPAAPAFSGPGALTGPTTATSTLLNPVANAAFSFVDADNDKLFTAGTDVALVNGEVEDGVFDTQVGEGGYTTAIPGAGLYLGGSPISAFSIGYVADGNLVVNTDLTATGPLGGSDGCSDDGADLSLTSRDGDVLLDDPAVRAKRDVEIDAAGDIISTDDLIGARRNVNLSAGGDIVLDGTRVRASKEIELTGASVDVSGSVLTAGKAVAIASESDILAAATRMRAGKEVELEAVDSIFASLAVIRAGKEIEIEAGSNVDLTEARVGAGKEIKIEAGGNVDLTNARLRAGKKIEIEAGGDVDLIDAILRAGKEIEIEADTVDQTGATLRARRVKITERNP
jgi:adhesin HecA-like repeat protein